MEVIFFTIHNTYMSYYLPLCLCTHLGGFESNENIFGTINRYICMYVRTFLVCVRVSGGTQILLLILRALSSSGQMWQVFFNFLFN